jgi:glutamate synthase domain-containing protein 3
MPTVDLAQKSVRELNAALHALSTDRAGTWEITHPMGKHAIAVGLNAPIRLAISGHVGYYCAGMNMQADVSISGNAGVGLAENMMSGSVRIKGNASQSAGATGHGGLLVIEGNAAARCGISMKGIDIVVKGSIGPMSAFMGQAGNLVVLGDAGENLGDSLYEARLFVRGAVKSLGADCIAKPMEQAERLMLKALLAASGMSDLARPDEFRMYGSARRLYHFHVDHADAY